MLDLGNSPVARELTEQERDEFLSERQLAVLGVAGEDGRPPLVTPIWYAYEPGGHITFYTGVRRIRVRKTRLIKQHRRVSILVQRHAQPYRHLTVEGAIVRIDEPPKAEQVFAVARRYLPEDIAREFAETEAARAAGDANPTLVHFTVQPERWLSMTY